MSLSKYKKKRNFKESPEPQGGNPDNEKFRFVIQKHKASHLHYDFRLEMEGVLKSWAVPKGPSTDPDIKRLAMMVEDHPYDYRSFEGIIPSGYGAGTVIIWDEGFYEPVLEKMDVRGRKSEAGGRKKEVGRRKEEADSADKKFLDKKLLHGLHSGKLHINLHGKKLKGEYALVKTSGRGENSWLLFKVKDKYVSKEDITKKDKSVISKKTIEQIEKTSTNFYNSETGKTSKNKSRSVKPAKIAGKNPGPTSKKKVATAGDILNKGKKSAFPKNFRPMLATLVDKPFDKEGWMYEVKWDGYRALALMNRGNIELKSRNDKSFNDKFYPVVKALEKMRLDAIIDGEVVVLDEKGMSNFGSLQNWRSEADGELHYFVFDVLWLDGKDLTQLPLIERKSILKTIIPSDEGVIRLSEHFIESGEKFFEAAKKAGLEGIIAKKSDSLYHPGLRTTDWLKIKANKRQEMVIGGFTKNADTSKLFSSLLVGVFKDGKLVYTGKVGTGFNYQSQKEMLKLFKPLITKEPPFEIEPDVNKPSRFRPNPPQASATWLKPKIVCEVSFTEMTTDGVMRHPSFEGLRTDKNANEVIMEKEKPVTKIVSKKKTKERKLTAKVAKSERKTLLNPTEETQVKKVNGHEMKFTNLKKIYWPKEKITKGDMINYYYQVAQYILPYLKDRPQSMNRHPDGITGESFYYKDVTGKAPDWIETYLYHSEADGRDRNYLVATDEASLLYMASLGCIEMNPWHSKVKSEDYPDWCVIDLDPAENTFNQVIEAAKVTNDILESMGVKSYPKTSGSTGIHIYIPLGAKYTYDQSKEFARVVATLVQREIPKFTSIERIVKKRKGKMYIDFLQNRPQATISAPYSLRPKPGATVSMPLYWDEVKKGLKMSDFTIYNAIDRIKSVGDIFKPVLGKGINLEKVIRQFNQ